VIPRREVTGVKGEEGKAPRKRPTEDGPEQESSADVDAPTTEYGANAEAGGPDAGYVEGEELPTEGRDDAPQG
jgi:hypothetical protein